MSTKSARSTVTMKTRPGVDRVLWLDAGTRVEDAIGRRSYRVIQFLGKGGFGAAYQVVRVSGAAPFPKSCVLKVTIDGRTWHREAYFGNLLSHVPALVEVYDSFAWAPGGNRAPLYCLVSEYLSEGDLDGYLQRHPEPWLEPAARREIVRLLRAVTRIHESGAVHRDITPRNVFVAAKRTLKLGDFGIALHRVGQRDVAADAFAPRFAPSAIQSGAKSWKQADDVHQLGQLFAALLLGDGSRKVTPAEVKRLECSAVTKSVLQRCIGERRKCFASAAEMLEALSVRDDVQPGQTRVRSLAGKRIVFTGPMSISRAEAKKLARTAGALVESGVSHATDVVVVGEQSPNWKAGEKGQKLLDVDREAELGHQIAIVKETRFLKLVGR